MEIPEVASEMEFMRRNYTWAQNIHLIYDELADTFDSCTQNSTDSAQRECVVTTFTEGDNVLRFLAYCKTDNGVLFERQLDFPVDDYVNCVKYMPQQGNILAFGTPSFYAVLRKDGNNDVRSFLAPHQMVELPGEQPAEGRTLSWNAIKAAGAESSQTYESTSMINEIHWHPKKEHIFGGALKNGHLCIWDGRVSDTTIHNFPAHIDNEVTSFSFNSYSENILATGSNEKLICLWDLRKTYRPLHTYYPEHPVKKVMWSPLNEVMIASIIEGVGVAVYDVSKIGGELVGEDCDYEEEDIVSESLFVHYARRDDILDFDWNPHVPWLIGSAENNSIVAAWKPAKNIVEDEDLEVSDEELEPADFE
ncbi:WD domain, G-beta repeat protein [Trichinella nativa]|uniref:WD domain, G-beta repeat protein n=1 Tax=Trichinella nativa TaxID=6335 RepID=A0A1Y3EGX7_9BILA|nr:WD domain, G-beta repeat protein [Trichinella nativa]